MLLGSVREGFDPRMMNGVLHPRSQGLEDPKAGGRPGISAEGVGRWRRDLSNPVVAAVRPILSDVVDALGYSPE